MSGDAPNPVPGSVADGSEPLASDDSTAPIGVEQAQKQDVQKQADQQSVDQQSVESTLPVDNEARLVQLEQEHSSLREEHETLSSQYMRIAADFDNFRKRQSRDQDDLRLQLKCTTLSEILPVVDNFERARQQLEPEGEEAQALHRSYQGLYKQLVDVLKQLGVAPMRVVGQVFDPTLHEAVLREPSDQHAEDVIVEELQRGYHLNGRVLRHALVKVSMGPGSGSQGAAPDSSQSVQDSVEDVHTAEESEQTGS